MKLLNSNERTNRTSLLLNNSNYTFANDRRRRHNDILSSVRPLSVQTHALLYDFTLSAVILRERYNGGGMYTFWRCEFEAHVLNKGHVHCRKIRWTLVNKIANTNCMYWSWHVGLQIVIKLLPRVANILFYIYISSWLFWRIIVFIWASVLTLATWDRHHSNVDYELHINVVLVDEDEN